jgi:hypothetical protein
VDSKSALALAKNPILHERSKHIRVRYHFIRDYLEEGSIKIGYINTKDQLAHQASWEDQVPGALLQDRDGPDFSQDDAQDLGGE